jgi:putative oxidoreductase
MGLARFFLSLDDIAGRYFPWWLASLALRVGLAVPFFRSGLTKWDGIGKLSESAPLLFENDFKINLPGMTFDFPYPQYSALAAGIAEIVLPIMLVLGFGTKIAALGLLIMTIVIETVFPDAWPTHLTWAAMALGILALGPGRFSIDSWLGRRSESE